MASRPPDFFRMLPRRAVLIFYAAVFFTFAPVGPLFGSSFTNQWSWQALVFLTFVSGALAVSWAATFTHSRWFVIGIVAFTALQIAFYGPMRLTLLGSQQRKLSLEAALFVALIVAGYVLFIVFISGRGRDTLRLQTEMDLAREIHETLVPEIRLATDRVEAHAVSQASAEVGGDLVDAVEHAGGVDLVLADVAGHGVRSGVVMSMVKAGLRATLRHGPGLGETVTALNALLEETTGSEMYATIAAVRVPPEGDDVEFVLAGHHHLLAVRANDGTTRRLPNQNLPAGLFPQTCRAESLRLVDGDLLVLYTDGLNETENDRGEQLGHDAIERIVVEHRHAPLERLREVLLESVAAHGGQNDDRSLLLIRLRGG